MAELIGNKEQVAKIDINRYVSDEVGLPTLNDIVQELAKPGRDPRQAAKVLEFAEDIRSLEDLTSGNQGFQALH